MKRYLVPAVLALLLLTVGCASQDSRGQGPSDEPGAQGESGGPGGPGGPVTAERMVADMKTRLGLSDEQVAALTPIIQEQLDKAKSLMSEARSGGSDAHKALRQKMDDLRWETDKKLAQVLTEDQMLAYSKWRDEMAAKRNSDRPEPPEGGPGGGRPPRQ